MPVSDHKKSDSGKEVVGDFLPRLKSRVSMRRIYDDRLTEVKEDMKDDPDACNGEFQFIRAGCTIRDIKQALGFRLRSP